MTIVIIFRVDTNGYPKEMCKETGRNGRRRNIGTGEVRKAAVGTGIKAVEAMVIRTAESVLTGIVADTKNSVKRMMDWDLNVCLRNISHYIRLLKAPTSGDDPVAIPKTFGTRGISLAIH